MLCHVRRKKRRKKTKKEKKEKRDEKRKKEKEKGYVLRRGCCGFFSLEFSLSLSIYIYIYIYIHIQYTYTYYNYMLRVFLVGIRSISEIASCFLGRDSGTLKSDIVSKKTSTINLFGFETLKLKNRRLKLWKPTVCYVMLCHVILLWSYAILDVRIMCADYVRINVTRGSCRSRSSRPRCWPSPRSGPRPASTTPWAPGASSTYLMLYMLTNMINVVYVIINVVTNNDWLIAVVNDNSSSSSSNNHDNDSRHLRPGPDRRVLGRPPTKSLDFRGFDSSRLLILRGGNYRIHIIV